MIQTKDALRASGFIEPLHNPELQDPAVADKFLEQAGLRPGDIRFMNKEIGYGMPMQQNGTPDPESLTPDEYMQNALQRIWALEKWQPGSANYITKHNKIYNFGRVPLRSLKLQYAPANAGRFRRRIHVAMASSDYNGALMDSMFVIDWAHQQLPEDVELHISEIRKKDVWLEQTDELAHNWQQDELGPDNADALIFAAHGRSDLIHFFKWFGGRAGTVQEITTKDAAGEVGTAIRKLSHAGTTILLDSCETALGSGNISETLHDATNLHTIAPKRQVGISTLRLRLRTDGMDIVPGFYEFFPQGERYVQRRSPAVHYRPRPIGQLATSNFVSGQAQAA